MSIKIEGLTEEMINEAVNNPGQTVSNQRQSFRPQESIPLRGAKNLRPNVKGQEGAALVTAPNMSRMNAIREEEEALIREHNEAVRAEKERQDFLLNPEALLNTLDTLEKRLGFLERANKKLTKQLNDKTDG